MTYTLRNKEGAPDYRYMPDPNLPPLVVPKVNMQPTAWTTFIADEAIPQHYISRISETMPELPHALRSRLQSQYGISAREADIVMSIQSGADVGFDGEPPKGGVVDYFEQVARASDPKEAINWHVSPVLTLWCLFTPLTGSHMNFWVS